GMPPMRSTSFSATMRMLNGIYQAQAAARPGVVYIDPWPVLSGANGHYSAYLPNGSGDEELVRQPDGVHLTVAGDVRLAAAVFDVLRALWYPPASTPPPAPSPSPSPAGSPSPSATPTPLSTKAARVAGAIGP